MRRIAFFLFLLTVGVALAQTGNQSRLAQLEKVLASVQQEQQAVYQQFQMVQELRRSDMQPLYRPEAQSPSVSSMQSLPSIDYDENVSQQRAQQERIESHTREMNALYARYVELAAQRKALLDQIVDLATQSGQ